MKRPTPLLCFVVALATTQTGLSAASEAPRFVRRPTLVQNPNPAVPLAAIVFFEASEPVETTIEVSDGRNRWELVYEANRRPQEGLPVIGFRPERWHELVITIKDADGNQALSERFIFEGPELPGDPAEFPLIKIARIDRARAEPGYRLFNPRRRVPRQTRSGNEQERRFGESFGMLMMVDREGTPVWYYRTDSRIAGFNYLESGRILYVTADYRIVEIDLLGNTTREWYAANRPDGPAESAVAVDALTFHHDIDLLDDGNILALSSERRRLEDYYTSEYDADAPRKDQWVMGDRAVEFTPEGEIVWEWKAFDRLPTERIGYETFSLYWERRGFPGTVDWSHANEITKLADGNILLNFRYLSAIVKVDVATGEIIWIFGEPSGWPSDLQSKLIRLEGDVRWPWHQHAPTFTERGTLLLFDNGNYRARPFEEPTAVADTWSRAVEYEISEENLTARQVWTSEIPNEQKLVTIAMGSALEMPQTGNILAGYGATLDPAKVDQVDWENRITIGQITRCIEYTRTNPGEVVWDLRLESTGENGEIGWNIFGCRPVRELRP